MRTAQDGDDTVIEKALKRFRRSAEAERDQRLREKDDLEFEFDPWTPDAKSARGAYRMGGELVPARPMLNIPMLDQPIQLVINQEKAAHLGIEVHPDSEDATDETAEVQQGLIRQIEVRSRASLARSWAFERAAKCGRGAYRILKRYCNPAAEGPEASDQELVISRILNQASVYLDPDAVEPDWSDGLFAFIVQDLSKDRYEQEFGDSKLAQAGSNEFGGITEDDPRYGWISDEVYRIAEYFEVILTPRKAKKVLGGALPSSYPQVRKVIWRKINAFEILDEREWDGQYIPIIPTIGREYNINGKRLWNGIIGPAKDPVRLVNSTASLAMEKIAIDVKSPWIIAEGQEEGHEAEVLSAPVSGRCRTCAYKPTSLPLGQPIGPPVQANIAGPNIQADIEMLQVSRDFVHGATFAMFDPSLGSTSPKDRSGKAILAQQQQADSSNSHYLDNLAEVSMTYESKVLLDMLGKVYDRPGRLVRITDAQDETKHVLLNQPFTEDPTGKPMAVQPGQPVQGPVKHYDLTKGSYTSVVSIGKSYQTKMQQGLDSLGQLLQAEPSLFPILGWRWMQYNDSIPHHEDIAKDLKKLVPPQLQDDNGANDPQKMQQQMQQLAQQHDLLVKELNAKNQVIETDQVKQQAQIQVKQIDAQSRISIAKLQSDTQIAVAAINAKLDAASALLEARMAATELTHEQVENEKDRAAHEVGLAAADAGADAAQSQQDHQQGLAAGDADTAHQAALADQGHQQALEQGQQSADLAPQPEAGA